MPVDLPVPRRLADITPGWMTAALAHAFPGAVVGAVQVGPVARGTNARARLALEYSQGDGPPSVFVKGPGRPANRAALAALRAYGTEARLAAARVRLPARHPVFYAGAVDTPRLAAVVVMEDVTAVGGRPHDGVAPLRPAQVADGLDGLARLHATHLGRSLPPQLAGLRPWRLGRMQAAASVANLARGIARTHRLAPGLLAPDLGAARLGKQFRRWAVLAASGRRTVLHGDPHPANTYGLAGDRIGFYDWQLARTGHFAHDVGYFLAGSLSPGDRRDHERPLFDRYLAALDAAATAAGVGGAVDPVECWDRYRASTAFGLATWLHTLAFGSFQPVELCLAMVARYGAAYTDLDAPGSPAWASSGSPGR